MRYPNFSIDGTMTEVLVSFLYVLPNAVNHVYESLAKELKGLMGNDGLKYVIMGDFNRNPSQLRCFKTILKLDDDDQKIEEPTHNQNGMLDLVYTNIHCATCGVLDSLTKTDHRPIFVSIPK